MRTKRPLQTIDPLCLPVGLRLGPWRVKSWRGRGAYGSLYCVEREGREADGEFALKLAMSPGDKRFAREAELLSRISSPHVPRFQEQGAWEHPDGVFPYVVMEWVEGEPLYEWARRRNPTSRQVLSLLAQVARALEATHAAGGLHRDVKGSNVLMRPGDGQVFLTDFGAGYYRGAATLTSQLLPPGTPNYRSPEAWAFVNAFLRHPSAHYPASTCDDLFALGVMAYRLVTDEYTPLTQPGEKGSEAWRQGGPGARPPRELNPRVSLGLEALILRLLSIAPVDRFGGKTQQLVEALDSAARSEGPEADVPLFLWCDEPRLRFRTPGGARLAAEQDAAARDEHALSELKARTQAGTDREPAPSLPLTPMRKAAAAGALLGLLAAGLIVAGLHRRQEMARSASARDSHDAASVAVGDSATPVLEPAPLLTDDRKPAVGMPMPDKPLPNQRKPPCTKNGEIEVRGGCWYRIADAKPPCDEDTYEWKGLCYLASKSSGRPSTAIPP